MPEGVGYPPDWVPGQNFVSVGGQLVDDDGDGVADREVAGQRVPVEGPDPVLEDLQHIRAGEPVPQLPPPGQSPPGGAPAPWAPQPQQPAGPPPDLGGAARGLLSRATRGLADVGQGVADAGNEVRQATYGTETGIRAEGDYSDDLARQAIEQDQAAGRAEAAAEGYAATRKAAENESHQHRVQSLVADRDKAVGAQVEKVQKLADEARATKINPGHLYQTADTGQKIAMYLSVAIGGFLAPKMGGKNPALDIINRAVENDIDAQKANLDNLREGVQAERSILGDLRQQFGDKTAAELALHGIALDQIANDLDGKLAGVKDQRALARGLELSAKLHAEAAEKQRLAMERERQEADRRWERGFKAAQLGETIRSNKAGEYIAGRKLTLEEIGLGLSQQQAAAKAAAEADGETSWWAGVQGAQGDDGHALRIPNATDRTNYDSAVGGAQQMLNAVASIRTILDNEGRTEFNDAEKLIAQSSAAKVLLKYSERVKGNPSDKDIGIVKKAGIGDDPTTWDPRDAWGRLSVAERKHVLEYVTRSTTDETDQLVKARTRGKASFRYQGTPDPGLSRITVPQPTFHEALRGFLGGGEASLLVGDRAASSAALNPQNRDAALAALAQRVSSIDSQLRTRKDLKPEVKAQLHKQRAEAAKAITTLKQRVEKAKAPEQKLLGRPGFN